MPSSLYRKCDKHNWRHIDCIDNAHTPTQCPYCLIDSLRAQLEEKEERLEHQNKLIGNLVTDSCVAVSTNMALQEACRRAEAAEAKLAAAEKVVTAARECMFSEARNIHRLADICRNTLREYDEVTKQPKLNSTNC